MKRMYADLHDKGLEIVESTTYYGYFGTERGLTPDQEFAKYEEHIKQFGIPWPTVFGPKTNSQSYGVGGIPHYVLIGRDGKVKDYCIGFSEPLHAKFREKVEAALAKK